MQSSSVCVQAQGNDITRHNASCGGCTHQSPNISVGNFSKFKCDSQGRVYSPDHTLTIVQSLNTFISLGIGQKALVGSESFSGNLP
jgi:hypothetical protein